ncbi:lipoprotein [Pseudomonas sp. SWRI92]|uniref:Lipoprotein n=1 Tax=Pseudomonas marvdashtae TaxID=2745500 RepID=A0A923JRG5_9PSED|nr:MULTISPECIES: lipoprotein [Pseudomonas]MBC3364875.1 lipoprotein [Pseudomonas sp. SWRI154]MBC3373325.1 lipoprotein [Pseudomonas sp. SWRI92]MBV4549598.1 lipoprotein [Pseudomonas marvdashtae]
MKRLISSLAALVAVACLVTACGQKGPLYLPDDSKSPEEQAEQAKSSQSKSHSHDTQTTY